MKMMMSRINTLPMKWRITLWSALWMCVFFLLYNSVQYLVLDRWILAQEENGIKKNMDEILGYYADNDSKKVTSGKNFLEKVNQPNQFIRILDMNGEPLLTISDDLPESWVSPEKVNANTLISLWHEQDHLLVMRSPIRTADFLGTIEIARNLESYERLNHILLLVMAIGGLGGAAFSMFAGVLLGRQMVKPVARLSETMEKITHNGLGERVEYMDNKDELSNLSFIFNNMMDRLEEVFQKQNQFVEDASHELKTPIAIIEGHLNLLARWGRDDPRVLTESLNASLDELARLKNLTHDLLASSEAVNELPSTERADTYKIVHHVVDGFAVIHPEFVFQIDIDALEQRDAAIRGYQLKQILMIVLDNAIKYSGEKKDIKITGEVLDDQTIQLQIRDKGFGIQAEHLPRVFDRFYRVDQARSSKLGGSGLGLSIAKRLIESYRGAIRIRSSEAKGTIVFLMIPMFKDEAEQ
jgi:two-component system sensor histidine kinase ArlS